jgi:hypothetical protein
MLTIRPDGAAPRPDPAPGRHAFEPPHLPPLPPHATGEAISAPQARSKASFIAYRDVIRERPRWMILPPATPDLRPESSLGDNGVLAMGLASNRAMPR